MTTVKRRPRDRGAAKSKLDMKLVVEAFTAFRRFKNEETAAKAQHEKLRDQLLPIVETFGVAHGETGAHQAIMLPEPVDGYVRLVRRKNVTPQFDLDAAEKLAQDKGVLAECQTVSLTMDGISATDLVALQAAIAKAKLEAFAPVNISVRLEQDKVYAMHQRDPKLITEAELDALIVEDVRYSFHPEKS